MVVVIVILIIANTSHRIYCVPDTALSPLGISVHLCVTNNFNPHHRLVK